MVLCAIFVAADLNMIIVHERPGNRSFGMVVLLVWLWSVLACAVPQCWCYSGRHLFSEHTSTGLAAHAYDHSIGVDTDVGAP